MMRVSRAVNAWRDESRCAWPVAAGAIVIMLGTASCSNSDQQPAELPGTQRSDDAGRTTPEVDASMDATTSHPVVDASMDAGSDASQGDGSCATTHIDGGVPTMCQNQCVDIESDKDNCGGCNQPCGITGTSCQKGVCKCTSPQVVCGSQCADVSSDESNCGFCGHNCQGNPCTMGLCQASSIAMALSGRISGIAVDSTTVYWTEGPPTNAGAYGKPFAGGNAVPFGAAKDPRGIVVDLTHLYWVDYGAGSVVSAPLLGGAPTSLVPPIGDGGVSPGPIAITSDSQNVYWVDSASGSVNQMPIQGGSIVPLATGRLTPMAIAVDATSVYWVDYGSAGNDGSVNKVAIGGTPNTITPLAISEAEPSAIAVDATNVYWADRANPNGTVKSVSINGGTANPIAINQGAPAGVAVDSQYVYWTNYDDNTVLKAPLAGGMAFTLASGQNNPSAIAVDDKNVYWANQGNGTILKVAK
jgi:hypothetical protein